MGTTTFFLRHNDLKRPLSKMTKKELKKLERLSPYSSENYFAGWNTPMELHNGNVYVLVFWKGQLMKISDAPEKLNKKYYNRYQGKTINVYEWTLLEKMILRDIKELDKKFKAQLRKKPPKNK